MLLRVPPDLEEKGAQMGTQTLPQASARHDAQQPNGRADGPSTAKTHATVVPTIDPIIGSQVVYAARTPTAQALRMGVCVKRAGLFSAREEFHSYDVTYGGMMIGHLLGGSLEVDCEGGSTKVDAGQFVVVDCLTPHSYVGSEDSRLEWVEVDGVSVPAFLQRLAPDHVAVFPADWSVSEEKLFSRVVQHVVNGKGSESEANRDITSFLYDFTARQERQEEHNAQSIHKIMNYISLHFGENLNIDYLAGTMGVDKFRFIRSFERIAGVTPYAYLLRTRIAQAQWILINSRNKISEIGKRCGFKSDTAFGVAFKKETGITPRQWRQTHRFDAEDQ